MHDFERKSVLEKLKEYFDLKFEEQKKEITDLKNEISKLKVEQREMIRETIKSTIQEEFAKILNEDKEKLFDKIDALKAKAENVDAGTLEKLKNEINKMIEEFKQFKDDSNESHRKLLELGDDMGKAIVKLSDIMVNVQDSILKGQKGRTDLLLDNILAVFKQNVGLEQKLNMLEKDLANKFNIVYDITKDTKDLVNRSRF
jgi:ATP-dependent Clp protease ATP-binding subunit ClpA